VDRPQPGDASSLGLDAVARSRVLTALRARLFGHTPTEGLHRYALGERLGRGGMGAVYRATDTRLGREVAVKLVRRDHADDAGDAQLVREAQALAMLSHPNVVEIYDVGRFGAAEHSLGGVDWERQGVFVVMELVVGTTLTPWIRRLPQALEWMRQAAAGLAAAHHAGLVHRDFKPSNVMVGDDGRVRVVDFGLASLDPHAMASTEESSSRASRDHVDTRTIAGTPGYMAPEVLRGQLANPRSDQYSFCVTLHEVMTGVRPTPVSPRADSTNVTRVMVSSELRPAVARVLERGLDPDPAQRFATIDDLLRAFTRAQARRTRRRWVAGLGLGAAGVAVLSLAGPTRSACPGLAGDEELWSPSRRDTAHRAVLATGIEHAVSAWARASQQVEQRWASLVETRAGMCAASLDEDQRRRMTQCLDEAAAEIDTIVTSMIESDPTRLDRLVPAALAMAQPHRCTAFPADDDGSGSSMVESEALQAQLVRAAAWSRLAEHQRARELSEQVEQRARELALPRIEFAAMWRVAHADEELGAHDNAALGHERAFYGAYALGDDRVAADAAISLAILYADRRRDAPTATRWAAHARAAIERRTDDTRDVRVDLELALASIAEVTWDFDSAREHCERGAALEVETTPEVLTALANVAMAQHRFDAATAYLESALAEVERKHGPDHADVALLLSNLGNIAADRDDLDLAERQHRRALEVGIAAFGPGHAMVGALLVNLALTHLELGRLAEATREADQALALHRAVFSDDHPDVAKTMTSVGEIALAAGEPDRAAALLGRALEIRERAVGVDHPELTVTLLRLAEADLVRGDHVAGLAALARVEEIFGSRADDPSSQLPLLEVALLRGTFFWEQGDLPRSVSELDRALELLGSTGDSPVVAAEVRLAAARTALARHERGRARELVAQARAPVAAVRGRRRARLGALLDTLDAELVEAPAR
jgi:tetratricopeptide (TPR) repeat protein